MSRYELRSREAAAGLTPKRDSISPRLSSPVKNARSSKNASRSRCVCETSSGGVAKLLFLGRSAPAQTKYCAYPCEDSTLIILITMGVATATADEVINADSLLSEFVYIYARTAFGFYA